MNPSEKQLPIMEEFYTIQGEGFHSGKAAYFIRIGGCDVGCHWCDVKESWNADLHPLKLVDDVVRNALVHPAKAVVITGGEPGMYDLTYLTKELKKNHIEVFLETSGAYVLKGEFDWVCLSPKKNMPPLAENYKQAHELKVIVYNAHDLAWAETHAAKVHTACHLFLQPEWSKREQMIPLLTDYIMQHPKWMVSLQTHKYLGIP
jgi:7-carboxy-7-deazaguanine synthase